MIKAVFKDGLVVEFEGDDIAVEGVVIHVVAEVKVADPKIQIPAGARQVKRVATISTSELLWIGEGNVKGSAPVLRKVAPN